MNLKRMFKQNGNGTAGANGAVIHMSDITKIYDTGKIKVEALRGIDHFSARGPPGIFASSGMVFPF